MNTEEQLPLLNRKAMRALLKCIRFLMVFSSATVVLIIVVSVFFRYFLRQNLFGYEEVLMIVTVWLYFMGAAYGSFEDSHVKADIITSYIKNPKGNKALVLAGYLILVAVNAILFIWSFDYMLWDLSKMPTSLLLKLPLIIPHSSIFAGMLLMLFFHVLHLIKTAKELLGLCRPDARASGAQKAKEGEE